ncbi:MAG TPA: 3-carboxy-cis,cis-muconate cycloisomerase [Terriglobales bacterium]|nr:3-carboxy-cis,cis-muconate cycloisomerase [Terriglobales bacterium]
MSLLDPLFGSEAIDKIFADPSRLQRMLDFEAALARAEARAGVIPGSVVAPIVAQCQAGLFDLGALAQSASLAGNLAIPMVKQLTWLVAQHHAEASGYVHWGATSQDAIDTGFVLQLRDACAVISADLNRLCDLLSALAEQHRSTPLVARTWMQHAVPTVFGLKVAGWLDALLRHRVRLQQAQGRDLVLQFGGAAGTLASLGGEGLKVAEALAEDLRLQLPAIPWHAHRDRLAEVATVLALLVGTLGKVARDLSLGMQTEVSELFEPGAPGRGGSSSMPHKRNPVISAVVLAAAERVPALTSVLLSATVQEHERGLGGWQAEWETAPEIVRLTAGALQKMVEVVAGLEIDAPRMRHNLDETRGLIFAEAVTVALGKSLGRSAAHALVEEASRKAIAERKYLADVLGSDARVTAHLSAGEIGNFFDPLLYVGMAGQFVDRVLAAKHAGDSEKGD